MKKGYFIIFVLISLISINVHAIDIGYSGSGEYNGVFLNDTKGTIAIVPGIKESLAVGYSVNYSGDSSDLGRIDVSLSIPSGMTLTTSSEYLEDGDTLTGSGSNYKININNDNPEFHGVGVFTLKMPNVSTTTEYNVTMTAKSYSKSGSLLQTKTGNYKFIVLVKPTNCDNNSEYTISSNLGGLTKVNDSYYTLSTTESKISFTLNPNSSKTKAGYVIMSGDLKEKMLENNSTGNINLEYGKNNIIFTLITECYELSQKNNQLLGTGSIMVGLKRAEDVMVSPKMVTVDITRIDNRSKVNTLKSLSISNVDISFKPELKNYIATVPYKVSSVQINSTLTDPKSSYTKGYGNRTVNLKEGLNNVQVKVKAENGSEAVYTIKITREKNDDSSLKSITVNDKEIAIKSGLLIYSTNVENDVVKPTIKAIPNDSKAKVEIAKFSDLEEGSNEISITVTASNGTKSVYVIDVIREKLISDNSKLKVLEIKNHEISFNRDELNYSVHISYDINQLDLVIEPEHEKATYVVTGNKDLENESIIKLKVTAEDQISTTTYSIKIKKNKKPFNILFVIIPAVLIFITIIIFVIKSKKGKKNNLNNINSTNNNVNEINNDGYNNQNNLNNINVENEFTPQKKDF